MGHSLLEAAGVPILIGVLTGGATLAGGVVAFRARSAIDLLLGFSCGAVIGVALFDLLPEALTLTRLSPRDVTAAVAVGFALYFVVDRLAVIATAGGRGHRGHLGPASLTVHSFTDGLGVGFAFQVSTTAGVVVALAVLAHDLCDGLNTVTLSLSGGGGRAVARNWLAADALAPLAGILAAQLVRPPEAGLALLLALFSGFFLYIGASELLPQTHERSPRLSTIAATLGGLAMIYAVVALAGG